MSEHSLRDATSSYLAGLGREVLFEKRWGGGYFQRKGVSDYTGIAWGVPFAIELKNPNEKPVPTQPQCVYLERVRDAGGETLVTNNLQDTKDFMARLRELGRQRGYGSTR